MLYVIKAILYKFGLKLTAEVSQCPEQSCIVFSSNKNEENYLKNRSEIFIIMKMYFRPCVCVAHTAMHIAYSYAVHRVL